MTAKERRGANPQQSPDGVAPREDMERLNVDSSTEGIGRRSGTGGDDKVETVLVRPTHIKHLALLGRRKLQRRVDVPRALVVQDVGPDLANVLGEAVAVEVVVLDLEVLAEGDEDGEGEVVRGLVGDGALIGAALAGSRTACRFGVRHETRPVRTEGGGR
jgi:hypothetical protein